MQTEIKLCECNCGLPAPISPVTSTRNGWVKGHPKRFISGHHNGALRHGSTTRGQWTPEYKSFHNARARCTNPKREGWENYGGRGIKFLFASFEQFFAELGPRPEGTTLDRKENNGNYAPGNVRWATRKEQNVNRQRAA